MIIHNYKLICMNIYIYTHFNTFLGAYESMVFICRYYHFSIEILLSVFITLSTLKAI